MNYYRGKPTSGRDRGDGISHEKKKRRKRKIRNKWSSADFFLDPGLRPQQSSFDFFFLILGFGLNKSPFVFSFLILGFGPFQFFSNFGPLRFFSSFDFFQFFFDPSRASERFIFEQPFISPTIFADRLLSISLPPPPMRKMSLFEEERMLKDVPFIWKTSLYENIYSSCR